MSDTAAVKGDLLFVITEDWYFLSHRLDLARAARDAGWRVSIACRVGDGGARIAAEGFHLIPLRHLKREGRGPGEVAALWELIRLYRRLRPRAVHHVAMKPVLYGTLAARLSGVPRIVNALAGMGYAFTSRGVKARLFRAGLSAGLRAVLRCPRVRVVVQNPDDRAGLSAAGIAAPQQIALIPGAGIDVARLRVQPEPAGRLKALCVARLLWDKGIGELVAAARLLKTQGVALEIAIAGGRDPANPACIPQSQLDAWTDEGVVTLLGHVADVPALWADYAIAVLPSYREGLPKALLEAAAAGRPLVTSDVPGCRDVCRDGIDGRLVPARSVAPLAAALAELAADPQLRARMGAAAREHVEGELSLAQVIARTLDLYTA